jgi:hypothetical protein
MSHSPPRSPFLVPTLVLVSLGHLGLSVWGWRDRAAETFVLTPYIEVVPGAAPLDSEAAARLAAELRGPVDARSIVHGYAWLGSTLSLTDLLTGVAALEGAGLPLSASQKEAMEEELAQVRADHAAMRAVQEEILDGERTLEAHLARIAPHLPPGSLPGGPGAPRGPVSPGGPGARP